MGMPEAFLQFGGLGIAGYVVWWLTRKLNGKVDAMVTELRETQGALRQLTATIERSRYGPPGVRVDE